MRSVFGKAMVAAGLTAVTAIGQPLDAQRGRTAPVAAPSVPELRDGDVRTDSLRAGDPQISGRGSFRTFRFTAKAAKRYVISLSSPDFDAFVWVAREVGGLTEELGSDDDSGGGTDARLRFRPPVDGSYLIVAQSLAAEGRGRFMIELQETDPPIVPAPLPIAVGSTATGTITDDSPEDDEEGFPYNHYVIRGSGERVRIVLRSEDFDAFLVLMRRQGGAEEQVAMDDDGAGGTDSRIVTVLDGEYRIVVRPLGGGGRGGYALSVEDAPPAPVTQRPIAIGQTVAGTLADTDPELDEGGFFHEYVVDARAGESLRITLRSEDFDAFLRWGTKDGNRFTELASDDDGGGNLDSELSVRADAAGRYVIRVSALGNGVVGRYELSVQRADR